MGKEMPLGSSIEMLERHLGGEIDLAQGPKKRGLVLAKPLVMPSHQLKGGQGVRTRPQGHKGSESHQCQYGGSYWLSGLVALGEFENLRMAACLGGRGPADFRTR